MEHFALLYSLVIGEERSWMYGWIEFGPRLTLVKVSTVELTAASKFAPLYSLSRSPVASQPTKWLTPLTANVVQRPLAGSALGLDREH